MTAPLQLNNPDLERAVVALSLVELTVLGAFVQDLIRERKDQMPTLFGLLPGCPVCWGTGRVGDTFCTCPDGVESRKKAATHRDDSTEDCPLFSLTNG